MASKKNTAPAPAVEDLSKCKIPGGIAYFYTSELELPIRKSRKLAAYDLSIMPRMMELMFAQGIVDEDGKSLARDDGLPGIPTGMTVAESDLMLEMTDVAAWAYLKDWTLKNAGEKVTLPEDVDDLYDRIGRGATGRVLVDALTAHANKIVRSQIRDKVKTGAGFTADGGMDDEDSPSMA